MSIEPTLFIFFVRAGGGLRVASTSSPQSWIEQARKAANAPGAEAILIEQEKWDAPNLSAFDDAYLRSKFPSIEKGIQKSLISHGVPQTEIKQLLEEMNVMSSPLTRLLVCVVKYTGEFSQGNKPIIKECLSCRQQTEALRRICPNCGKDSFAYSNFDDKHEVDEIAEEAAQQVDRGAIFFGEGKYMEAELLFRAAIEINPFNDIAHYNLGYLLVNVGRPNAAISSLEKALELNPHDMDIQQTLKLATERAG